MGVFKVISAVFNNIGVLYAKTSRSSNVDIQMLDKNCAIFLTKENRTFLSPS
jgi:hypothetical protein